MLPIDKTKSKIKALKKKAFVQQVLLLKKVLGEKSAAKYEASPKFLFRTGLLTLEQYNKASHVINWCKLAC